MKKKVVIGIAILLLLGLGWMYLRPVSFYKNSIYIVLSKGDTSPNIGTVYHADISYRGMKKVTPEITDYTAKRVIDPALRFGEQSTQGTWLHPEHSQDVMVNLTQDNIVEFSEITYTESGKAKKADIGNHHYEMVNSPMVKEAYIGENSSKDHSFYMYLETVPENLKRIELANPDIEATISEVEKTNDHLYRYQIQYKPNEEYKQMASSVKYIIDEDGKEEICYGGGVIHISSKEIFADHYVDKVYMFRI